MSLKHAFAPLLDLVFPPRCPLCGAALGSQSGLCGPCWNALVIPGEPGCALCQRPLMSAVTAGAICAPCLMETPRHNGIAAATVYNDASRQLVLGFKHGGHIALAPLMARMIAARLGGMDGDWLVLPVPLHRWRMWRRGYNQAALLARELAKLAGGRLVVDGLCRVRATPSLGGLDRKARAKAMRGAIQINPRRKPMFDGAKVLLVDDVLTSGATSNAAIAVLRRAGVAEVRIACFARVL